MEHLRDYSLIVLPNGIRWIHKQVKHTKIAHCGIMLDVGSRDEKEDQLGLAHFWEHMAFKGTKTKKSSYILSRIDQLGGELNAYTTKEKICFHASLLSKHYEKAIELLADITFNSVFPQKEIEKERQVILEEMSMYADDPEDAIQDEFDEVIFVGNPLGNNILGTKKSVSGFNKIDFDRFLAQNMDTSRMVICTVSNFTVKKAQPVIEKYLAHIPEVHNALQRSPNGGTPILRKIVKKPGTQAHCMMGCKAYSLPDKRRLPLFMLTNLLGGPAMNTRLNLSIREKYGLVYHIDAQYSPYVDTGLFSIYFGTEQKTLQKSIDLVLKELKKLREIPLTPTQLKSAKEQLKGQLAMSEENNNGMMLMLAKSILDIGHVESLDSIFQRIDKVSSVDLQQIAMDIFKEEEISYLIYEPAR